MSNQTHPALTEIEVAARLGLSVATLRAWRIKAKGPRFLRFGRAVRYLVSDVDQFIEQSRANEPARASSIDV